MLAFLEKVVKVLAGKLSQQGSLPTLGQWFFEYNVQMDKDHTGGKHKVQVHGLEYAFPQEYQGGLVGGKLRIEVIYLAGEPADHLL